MASWVLNCPQCNTEIIHSDIPEFESSIPDPFGSMQPGFDPIQGGPD